MDAEIPTTTHTILVFKLFERIWHWSQAASIFVLIFTGFAIHGVNSLISFETAVKVHTAVALALLLLWVFATFWLFTTGQWQHYIPTGKNLFKVARFYAFGIFKGERHPYRKTYLRVTTQRIIQVRAQVIDFSGICNMDVAVERTWTYLQRP